MHFFPLSYWLLLVLTAADEIWIRQCFVIIDIFQTISIHFNPAKFKLLIIHHLCKHLIFLALMVISTNIGSNLLNCLLFTPPVPYLPAEPYLPPTHSVLWSFCDSLLWNPLFLPTSVHLCNHFLQPQSHLMTELQPFPGCHTGTFNKLLCSFCRFPLISACSCHSCQL